MTLQLYQEVALAQDIPDHQLQVGDIATLIDFVAHPDDGEERCVLEVFNASPMTEQTIPAFCPLRSTLPASIKGVISAAVSNQAMGEIKAAIATILLSVCSRIAVGYFASIQFGPAWASTLRGTFSSTADSMVDRILGSSSAHSSGGTSNTSSSCTCSSRLAW
jgi:hypothetical protein